MEKTRCERNKHLHQEIKKKNEEKELQLKNLSYKQNREILSSVDSSFFDGEKNKTTNDVNTNEKKARKHLIYLSIVGIVILLLVIIILITK